MRKKTDKVVLVVGEEERERDTVPKLLEYIISNGNKETLT